MFREYARKNWKLSIIGSIIVIQIFLSIGCCLLSNNAHHYFNSLNTSQTPQNWNLWNWIWRSGEVMSIYGNIKRLNGYQNNLQDIIKDLINSNSSSLDINNFEHFHFNIQLCTAFVCIIGILSAINLVFLCKSLWEYALEAQSFNFKKLGLTVLLNLIGLYIAYIIESKNNYKSTTWNWLLNWAPIKTTLQLQGHDNDFQILENESESILEVKNLNYSITNKTKTTEQILKDINFTIKPNSLNVVIGPNGSGKTTLIKSIINLNEGFTGDVLWGKENIKDINKTEFARQISYIPQFLNLQNPVEIVDFLEIFRYPYKKLKNNNHKVDREIVLEALRKNNCQQFQHKIINELSGGQKQKILLTSVLAQESKVIILDEPTSFLDIKNQHQFLEILKEFQKQHKTIIMILHDLQQAVDYADNLIVLNRGSIQATGTPRDIITPELLKDVFKIDCNIEIENNRMKINNIYAI